MSAGRRPRAGPARESAGRWGDFDRTDLTGAPVTGHPVGVCTVALAVQGNDVKIKAITKTGKLHHTHCGTNGRAVTCDAPGRPRIRSPER